MQNDINPLVLALLEWTEEYYCQHQYVQGINQIARLLSGQVTSLSTLEESPVFWNAFKGRWNDHDEEWLSDLMEGGQCGQWLEGNGPTPAELYDGYMNYHLLESFETLPVQVQRIVNEQLRAELSK